MSKNYTGSNVTGFVSESKEFPAIIAEIILQINRIESARNGLNRAANTFSYKPEPPTSVEQKNATPEEPNNVLSELNAIHRKLSSEADKLLELDAHFNTLV